MSVDTTDRKLQKKLRLSEDGEVLPKLHFKIQEIMEKGMSKYFLVFLTWRPALADREMALAFCLESLPAFPPA